MGAEELSKILKTKTVETKITLEKIQVGNEIRETEQQS
jgi:hypothetical protein